MPRSVRPWCATLLAGLLLAGLLLAAPAAHAQGGAAPAVEVAPVARDQLAPVTRLLGTTEPKRQSAVAAAIQGYVIGYPVREGEWVEEGQVLTKLRDDILRMRVAEAEAAIEEIEEQRRKARLDLERAQKLLSEEAITQKEFDALESAAKVLEHRVPQAEAQRDIYKSDLAKKTVVAPFAGQIVREETELGQWVPQGGTVAVLVDLSSLFIRVSVPERHVRYTKVGQEVAVRFSALGPTPYTGRVASVVGLGDRLSRTFDVRIEVPGDGEVLAGMSAEVSLPAGESRDGLVVPSDAILLQSGQPVALVVGDDGTVQRRVLRTGISSGRRVEVLDGVAEGERVIVRGNERVQPGQPVRVLEPRSEPDGGAGDPGAGDPGAGDAGKSSEARDAEAAGGST